MNLYVIFPLIAAVVNLFLCFFVFLNNKYSRINRAFAVWSASIAFWNFGLSMMYSAPNIQIASFWARVLVMGLVFIPPTFYQFVLAFVKDESRPRQILCNLGYVFAFSLIVLNLMNYFDNGVVSYYWGYYPLVGIGSNLYNLAFALMVPYSFYIIFLFYKRSTGSMQKQIKYILWASAIGWGGGVTNMFPLYGIEIYPIGNLCIIFFSIIVAYAITKHKLMDISVVISRTAAHILTAMFLATGYLAFLLIYRKYVSASIDAWFVVGTVIYGIFVGEYFQRIRLHVQTTAEKLILTGRYDYSRVLKTISRDLSKPMTIEEINKTIDNRLREMMDVRRAEIINLR